MKKKLAFIFLTIVIIFIAIYKMFYKKVNNIPSTLKRKNRVYDFEDKFGTITIIEELENIIIRPSKNNRIYFISSESNEYYYNILKGENLLVTLPKKSCIKKLEDIIRKDKHPVILEIPKKSKTTLILKTKKNINIEDLSLKSFNAISKNGDILIKDLELESNCNISNSNGNTNVKNINVNSFTCTNINGKIVLNNIEVSKGATITSINDDILGENIFVKDILSIKNRNGNVKLKSLNFNKEASIKNINGNSIITLKGNKEDYKFSAVSRWYSKINIPSSNEGGKPIYLKNKNGDIDISLE